LSDAKLSENFLKNFFIRNFPDGYLSGGAVRFDAA